jgi:hypothetical protein
MTEFEVESKAGVMVALRAAAQPTFEQARAYPFSVALSDSRFKLTFNKGVTEARAEQIVKRLAQTTRKAWGV